MALFYAQFWKTKSYFFNHWLHIMQIHPCLFRLILISTGPQSSSPKTLKLFSACVAGANEPTNSQLWYKQWKVRRGCLEKFALGNSQESSYFPEWRSPRESLMTRGNSHGQICQTIPEDFPLFFRLSD